MRPFFLLSVVILCVSAARNTISFSEIPDNYMKVLFVPEFSAFIATLTEENKEIFAVLADFEFDLKTCGKFTLQVQKKDSDLKDRTNAFCTEIENKKTACKGAGGFLQKVFDASVDLYSKHLLNETITLGEVRKTVREIRDEYNGLDATNKPLFDGAFPHMKNAIAALPTKPTNSFTLREEFKVNFAEKKTRTFVETMGLTAKDIVLLGELTEQFATFERENEYFEAMENEAATLSARIKKYDAYMKNYVSLKPETKAFMEKVFDGRSGLERLIILQEQPDMEELMEAVEELHEEFENLGKPTKVEIKAHFPQIEPWLLTAD